MVFDDIWNLVEFGKEDFSNSNNQIFEMSNFLP